MNYNSFALAKIANPECEIYRFDKSFTCDSNRFGQSLQPCNPADHCMTIERFLADGHKFVGGDIALIHNGDVKTVVNPYLDWNTPNPNDNIRFILRAAALEEKHSEKVEWVNGDECNYGGVDALVVGYCSDSSWIVIEHSGEVESVNVMHISKPETKQQREDRERLEAAYDLYRKIRIETKAPSCDTFESFKINEHAVTMWTSIVKETNYRKESK